MVHKKNYTILHKQLYGRIQIRNRLEHHLEDILNLFAKTLR